MLAGTEVRKVHERKNPPTTKSQYAKEYRYFDLEKDVPEHLANEYPEKDMHNVSEWKSL